MSAQSGGQALAEFAIVFPVFLLVFFAIIDAGRYIYVYNALSEASREGARYGAVSQWQYACPSSVVTQTRLSCTQQETLNRIVTVGANVQVGANECNLQGQNCTWRAAPICQAVDGPVPPLSNLRTVTAAACSSNDLLTVSARVNGFQFLTPIIGRLLGSPTIMGTSRVVVQ